MSLDEQSAPTFDCAKELINALRRLNVCKDLMTAKQLYVMWCELV